MDAEGNVLTKPPRSVAGFVEVHAKTKELMALRAKGDKATADDKKAMFLAELKLDMVPADQIQSRADEHKLSDAEKGIVAQKLVDAEVTQIMGQARQAGAEQTGEKLAALAKAGKLPSETARGPFWVQVLNHASRQKDGDLAQQAFDALEKHFAKDKNPQLDRAKQAWKKLLDDAKAK